MNGAQGAWVGEFSAGACPAENDRNIFFRRWRKNWENPCFSRAPFLRVSKEEEIRLNCPFCGAEMESGVLQGGGGHAVCWREKPRAFSQLKEEIITDGDFFRPSAPAHRCTKCRKIILDY